MVIGRLPKDGTSITRTNYPEMTIGAIPIHCTSRILAASNAVNRVFSVSSTRCTTKGAKNDARLSWWGRRETSQPVYHFDTRNISLLKRAFHLRSNVRRRRLPHWINQPCAANACIHVGQLHSNAWLAERTPQRLVEPELEVKDVESWILSNAFLVLKSVHVEIWSVADLIGVPILEQLELSESNTKHVRKFIV